VSKLRLLCFLACLLGASGCFYGNEFDWASENDVKLAAYSCGLKDFVPTPAGEGWAAYVDETEPCSAAKEDCIYAVLRAEGLLATR
jgi:hypothetical protein